MRAEKATPPPDGRGSFSVSAERSLLSLRSLYRTDTSASAAIEASVCIDNVLVVTLRDRAYRALLGASAAADACIGDLICHNNTSVCFSGADAPIILL